MDAVCPTEGSAVMRTRQLVMPVALVATLAAVYFAPPSQEDTVVLAAARQPAAAAPGAAPSTPPKAAPATVVALKPRLAAGDGEGGLFATESWAPPAPKPAKAAPLAVVQAEPPPPTAPAVPLKLLGRYEETTQTGAKVAVFALFNDQNVVLRAGETIGTDWRVDAIEANQVVLTYLPLGQKQNLPWTATP